MRKDNENGLQQNGIKKDLETNSVKQSVSNDTSLLIAKEDELITLFNNYKAIKDPVLLSHNLENFIKIIKSNFFDKNIDITDKLYNLLITENILKEAKIKYAQEINAKIKNDYSKTEKFNLSKEQKKEILQDISFILFLFGVGKNIDLNKESLENLYFTDNSKIYTFIKSIISNETDIQEFLVVIDTIGKIFPIINTKIQVGDRIIGKQFFDKFLLNIYEYEKIIGNNQKLSNEEKILNINKIYEIKDNIIKLYNESTIHSSIYKATYLSNDILKTINDGIIIIDKKSDGVLGANDGFCKIIGIKPENLTDVISKKSWPIEGFKQINDEIYEYNGNNGIKKFFYCKKMEGDYFLLKDNGYILSLIDITERKKAEEERDAILKLSPNGIFILKVIRDKNNEIIDFEYEKCNGNKNICLGEEKDIIGRTIKERFDKEISDKIESACKDALKNKTNITLEYKFNDKFYELNIGPYYLDDSILIYKTDITDKKNIIKEKIALEKADSTKKGIMGACYSMLREIDKLKAEHCEGVSEIAKEIGKELGYDNEILEKLDILGKMHDIGKIGITKETLNKSGLLNNKLNFIQENINLSKNVLDGLNSNSSFIINENTIKNNEKNGLGNLNLLNKNDIEYQIINAADLLDTIGRDVPYKKAKGLKKAIEILQNEEKEKYDKDIINAILKLYKKGWFNNKGFKD